MQSCAQHVQYQLPNKHTRVGYLLDGIDCSNTPLQAVIANVEDNTGDTGKMNYFKTAVAYLLPKDPVVKKQSQSTKRNVAEISNASPGTELKSGNWKDWCTPPLV